MIDTGAIIIGHLAGDYLFQNDWMAGNKKLPGTKGAVPCFIHCLTYALVVTAIGLLSGCAVSMWWALLLLAFFSHYVIDRTTLIDRWMNFYGQTTFKTIEKVELLEAREIRRKFLALVYVGVDNSAHLLLMWVGIKVMGL